MSNDHLVRGTTTAGTNDGSFAPHHKAEADPDVLGRRIITDPNGHLSQRQLAEVATLAGLIDADVTVETSTDGRVVDVLVRRARGLADEVGDITRVHTSFWKSSDEPNEVKVQSSWAWDDEVGGYTASGASAVFSCDQARDKPDLVRTQVHCLAQLQDRLDAMVNKPMHRLTDPYLRSAAYFLQVTGDRGTNILRVWRGASEDQFTFKDDAFTAAVIRHERYGQLRVSGEDLDQVIVNLGHQLQGHNPGVDMRSAGTPYLGRRNVEKYLLGS